MDIRLLVLGEPNKFLGYGNYLKVTSEIEGWSGLDERFYFVIALRFTEATNPDDEAAKRVFHMWKVRSSSYPYQDITMQVSVTFAVMKKRFLTYPDSVKMTLQDEDIFQMNTEKGQNITLLGIFKVEDRNQKNSSIYNILNRVLISRWETGGDPLYRKVKTKLSCIPREIKVLILRSITFRSLEEEGEPSLKKIKM